MGLLPRYGHPTGDDLLVHIAEAISSVLRKGETVARVGGEEFAALLVDSTGNQARLTGERIRQAVGDAAIRAPNGDAVSVTISVGIVSTSEFPALGPDALYAKADEALYRAKQQGRNRVQVSTYDQQQSQDLA